MIRKLFADLRRRLRRKDETQHLLHSPKNAERLLHSIAEAEAGNTTAHDLIDHG
jgi:antitoxin YefM